MGWRGGGNSELNQTQQGPMGALNLKLFYSNDVMIIVCPCPAWLVSACNCFVVSILFSSTFVELFAIYTHKQQQQQQKAATGSRQWAEVYANSGALMTANYQKQEQSTNRNRQQMNLWGEPAAPSGSLATGLCVCYTLVLSVTFVYVSDKVQVCSHRV